MGVAVAGRGSHGMGVVDETPAARESRACLTSKSKGSGFGSARSDSWGCGLSIQVGQNFSYQQLHMQVM